MNSLAKLSVLSLSITLAACNSTSDLLAGDKIDYKSATKGPTLEVPPDLTQLSKDSRYVVPGGTVSAAAYQVHQDNKPKGTANTAAAKVGDVQIERDGNQRWLVIDRPADQVWEPVKDFWQESGFALTTDRADIGIMETDWAENRAKLPQDFIRKSIGKVFDSVYSTGEQDKFRTRIERRPDGKTEIYVSHRGMEEVYSNKEKDSTIWQPRKADPELETEFLRRIMVKLGVSEEQSKAVAAAPLAPVTTSTIATQNGAPVLQVTDPFDRTWRRVGLALDRTGFTVEDRDRSQGIYFVRYIDPTQLNKKADGFFGKLFNRNPDAPEPIKYRIQVKSDNATSVVSVLNASGQADNSANAQRIVKVLADDMK
ncbi:MAG: outer membrane protein assembly factor BamC [Comamonas sp.]